MSIAFGGSYIDRDGNAVEVKNVVVDSIGREWVIFEKGDFVPHVVSERSSYFSSRYSPKPHHDLKPGDFFTIETPAGSGIAFLYLEEESVVRIGYDSEEPTRDFYGSNIGRSPLHFYVRTIGGGKYSNINILNNIDRYGYKVEKS